MWIQEQMPIMTSVLKRLDYVLKICYQYKLNSQHKQGEPIWSFYGKEFFHLDDEEDIYRSSKQFEKMVACKILDFLIISHKLRVLCPTRSVCNNAKMCLFETCLPYEKDEHKNLTHEMALWDWGRRCPSHSMTLSFPCPQSRPLIFMIKGCKRRGCHNN